MKVYPSAGYEDLRITAFAPRTSAPVQANFTGAPAGYEIQSWEFANNGTERGLNGVTQFPHGWYGSRSSIWMHVHMSTTGALAEGVVVGFFISLLEQPIGVALASARTTQYWCGKTVPVGGYGAKTHIMTTDVEIPYSSTYMGMSSLLMLYVFRKKGTLVVTANAGDVTENVDDVFWLHEVDFHIKRVRLGSTTP